MSPLIATSVITQSEMIKTLLKEKGYEVEYKSALSTRDIDNPQNKAFLWFTLATIRFLGDAIWPYSYCKKPKAVYVTIEGIPSKANIICSNVKTLDFIAVSHFVERCLKQTGLKVIDVVHHAVDYEKCLALKKDSLTLKKKWESEYGDRIKFLYVGRNDPRKGLNKLARAIGWLNEDYKDDFVMLMVSEGDVPGLTDQKNVIKIGQTGSMQHDDVMRIMGAADFFAFPSMCEGFGMGVLEANAMGVPAIHCWFPPLDEFSSKDFNFVFNYQGTQMVNQGNVQYWIFHDYRPETMAEMMAHAIKIFRDSRGEYQEYCQKALDHTKAFDFHKIYPRILSHLKIE